ncbi:MAG: hypothetical protein ACREKL_17055 [Chthoniobacterales bacterium]
MKLPGILPVIAALVVQHAAFADEDDKAVPFDRLPAAVAKAFTAAAGDAKLKEVTSNDDNGTPAFEAVWFSDEHRHQLTVAATGRVIALEEQLKLEEVPAGARAAITKEAGDKKIGKIEKVTEAGKVCYEATVGGAEIRYDETGKVLSRD